MAGAVVCAGRLYADVVLTGLDALPRLGRESYAQAVLVTPGGGAFITAAHLRGLDCPATLAAALGDDPVSAALLPRVAALGLDDPPPERFAGGPQLTVALAVGGDRAFATCRCGPAVPAGLRARLAGGGVRHLHVAELATLLEEPWLLAAARAAGATVSVDFAWDEAALAHPRALVLARQADLLLPNESEAAALAGLPDGAGTATLEKLAEGGAAVVVKRGARGAVALLGGVAWEIPAVPIEVVDATGAGDAFNAGFLDAWLDGRGAAEALAQGVACGSLAAGRAGGAEAVPDRAAVTALAARIAARRTRGG